MKELRTVIVAFGNMGRGYARYLWDGQIKGLKLAGICCRNREGQEYIREHYEGVRIYQNDTEMLAHPEEYDAMIITTPHKEHVRVAGQALKQGTHVLCEKPAGICAGEVRKLAEEAGRLDAAYALIFNWRARPLFRRMKELLEEGVPGHITRIVWISNIWYRTPAYHNAALWRSSWNGEGGGVLINQGQHLLDMWQWLFGEPDAVRAFIDFGKFNDITVDDNADLFFEYKDGRKGTFITSTGEAPGSNHLEVHGSRGRLVLDRDTLVFEENDMSTDEFAAINREPFGNLPWKARKIEVEKPEGTDPEYIEILQNFADHILRGVPLIAPGSSGVIPLEMANGAYLSAWLDQKISFPIDDGLYGEMLKRRQGEELAKN